MEGTAHAMEDGASPTQSSSSGAHSPVDSKAASGFRSYAEYRKKVKPTTLRLSHYETDVLWLASFDGNGHCLKWNFCDSPEKNGLDIRSDLPAVNGSGIRPYAAALSCHDFKMVLQTPDENVAYRVVIMTAGKDTISSQTKDILGLGLDLEPGIFDYAQMCIEYTYIGQYAALPQPWYKTFPGLQIGNNVLCILEDPPVTAPKTAILFLGTDPDYQGFANRIPTRFAMFPPKRPSQIPEGFCNDPVCFVFEYENTWLVQRFITSGIGSNDFFGKGNFLYVCLAALIELQLSTAPLHVPHFRGDGLQSQVQLEYYGQLHLRTERPLALSADPSTTWTKLRMEVDAQRSTLRWIKRFFRKHFDCSNEDIRAAFEDTLECLTFRLQDLEQSESHLRDQLAAEGTSKSIHMAEMSIRESKRVMLLTALAFIFLPVSLASSVYGMNVQEINSTGHSIGAFVITAIVMCASSVALWAAFATLQSHRARLLSRQKSAGNTRTSKWHEELIMNGPLGLLWHVLDKYFNRAAANPLVAA